MRQGSGSRVRTARFVLLVALITGGMLSAASFASTDTKKARGDFVPSAAAAGATSTYRLELTNDVTSNQTFGSANVSIPTGFSVDGTSITADRSWTTSLNSTSGVIELRAVTSKRALPPGQKLVVTFTATAPCEVGTYVWQTLIKQSNDFNGTGNDFVVDPQPSVTVSGTCGGGGGGSVCTSGPCTSTDSDGLTSVTTTVPPNASLSITFGSAGSECVGSLIGSSVTLVPSGAWTATEVLFEWDKSIAPGTGVANFKLCWSKPGSPATELPKCGKKPNPTCELSRSRNGAGDLQIRVLLDQDPDFELG